MPELTAFEERLDNDLKVYLDPHAEGGIPAWRMPEPRRSGVRLLGGAGAALGAKIAVGAVIAVMAAGATTEAVITRSANPADWARQVTQQVQPSPRQSQPVTNATAPVPTATTSTRSPSASTPTAVVHTPALPTVSAPAIPTPKLPLPSPTPLPSLP